MLTVEISEIGFRKLLNRKNRIRRILKRRKRRETLQKANSIMQKLFEIEDETPAALAAQSSADTDQVTLPSGISVHLPVSWCGSYQSDSVSTFGSESPTWDDSVRGWGSSRVRTLAERSEGK